MQRRNFDYYDPITTGDSSLSACVQSIVAAQVGHHELAFDYFEQSLYLDLANTHGNTDDGVHIANVGGVWAALVHGFAGVRDTGDAPALAPAPPGCVGTAMRFRLLRHGSVDRRIAVDAGGADGQRRQRATPVPVARRRRTVVTPPPARPVRTRPVDVGGPAAATADGSVAGHD